MNLDLGATLLSVHVEGYPTPQGSKRIVPTAAGPRLIEASGGKLKAWRSAVAGVAREEWGDREPYLLPTTLRLTFRLERPKSNKQPVPATRPDLDKLVRAVGDALVTDARVLRDDAQIILLTAMKTWATPISPAGVSIDLREWG